MNTTGARTARHDPSAAPPANDTDDTADGGSTGATEGPPAAAPAAAGTGEGGSGGGAQAAWELRTGPRAAAQARRLTARTLRGWRVTEPGDVDDVVLMVGELVTNAVVHGAGPVRLALRLDGRRLLAEVRDADPALPALPALPAAAGAPDWAEAGRGLLLVAALAAEHGARPERDGKTVWFTRLLNPLGGRRPGAPPPTADLPGAH